MSLINCPNCGELWASHGTACNPKLPGLFASSTGSSDRPNCGKCGKSMTPENSTAAPEYFLCDDCAVEVGLKPRRRIDPQARIKELIEAIEEIRQVSTGERQVGNDDTDGLDWIARRIAALNPPNDKLTHDATP